MAARAQELGDTEERVLQNWEKPFGTPDVTGKEPFGFRDGISHPAVELIFIDGASRLTVPRQLVRRCLYNLPRFVVTRDGEYCFMPGIRAIGWLSELET
ncbi:MAG: hypothetical protein ACHQ03_06955 [Candidatus Bathyarchaeia archaeon]